MRYAILQYFVLHLQILSADMLVLELLGGRYALSAKLGDSIGGRYRDLVSLELTPAVSDNPTQSSTSMDLLERLTDMASVRKLLGRAKTTQQLPQTLVTVVDCLARANDFAKDIQQLSPFYAMQCNTSGV